MRTIALVVGVVIALLGGLWLLQGLGVLTMRPILCFANCEPVQGPSTAWSIAGLVMLAAGAAIVFYSRKRDTGGGA